MMLPKVPTPSIAAPTADTDEETRQTSYHVHALESLMQHDDADGLERKLAAWPSQMRDQEHRPLSRYLYPALVASVRRGHGAQLSYMLSGYPRGAKSDLVHDAIQVPSSAVFQAFLEHGWDINHSLGTRRRAALGYVLHSDELVDWFLAHDASPNAGYDADVSVLSSAVYQAPVHTITKLFAAGGDVRRGRLLHCALLRGQGAAEVLRMLLERGAPVNALDYDGVPPDWYPESPAALGTPLHEAAKNGNSELVSVLLDGGARNDIRNTVGKLPADLASERGHIELVSIEQSVDIPTKPRA
ncbi:MAG: hypothetical protein Q9159_002224 [Coniocarpon cinnabarinum]